MRISGPAWGLHGIVQIGQCILFEGGKKRYRKALHVDTGQESACIDALKLKTALACLDGFLDHEVELQVGETAEVVDKQDCLGGAVVLQISALLVVLVKDHVDHGSNKCGSRLDRAFHEAGLVVDAHADFDHVWWQMDRVARARHMAVVECHAQGCAVLVYLLGCCLDLLQRASRNKEKASQYPSSLVYPPDDIDSSNINSNSTLVQRQHQPA